MGERFFFNGILIGCVNGVVNFFGRTQNDYLLAYKILLVLAHAGNAGLAGLILLRCTGSLPLSVCFAFAISLIPGSITLLLLSEDNIIASLMHSQYLLVFLACCASAGGGEKSGRGRVRPAELLLPFSLLAAVLSHHQLNVLWVTPALLLVFGDRSNRKRTAVLVAVTYLVSLGGFAAFYVVLVRDWLGEFTPGGYFSVMKDWFVPNEYYRQFYFYNEFGWDLPRQAHEILRGVRQLLARRPMHATVLFFLHAGAFGLTIAFLRGKGLLSDTRVRVLLTFILIHLPHSMIYESYSLERWDVIVVPGVILFGLLTHELLREMPSRSLSQRRLGLLTLLPLVFSIFVYNIGNYVECRRIVGRHVDSPAAQALAMKLHQNVVREPSDVRKTLILLDTQWESDYVYAAAYFDYKTSLFFISEEGTLSRSKTVYPDLERVDPEEFKRIVAGSFLIADSTAMKYLAPIIDPEGPTDRR